MHHFKPVWFLTFLCLGLYERPLIECRPDAAHYLAFDTEENAYLIKRKDEMSQKPLLTDEPADDSPADNLPAPAPLKLSEDDNDQDQPSGSSASNSTSSAEDSGSEPIETPSEESAMPETTDEKSSSSNTTEDESALPETTDEKSSSENTTEEESASSDAEPETSDEQTSAAGTIQDYSLAGGNDLNGDHINSYNGDYSGVPTKNDKDDSLNDYSMAEEKKFKGDEVNSYNGDYSGVPTKITLQYDEDYKMKG